MASKSSTKQDGEATTEEVLGSIVTCTEEEIQTFRDDMASENTKKSTSTSVRSLQSWYLEKYKKELNLNSISKAESPKLLKHFFRQTGKKKTKAKNTSGAHYRRTVMVSDDIFCSVHGLQLLTTLLLRILKKFSLCCP